MAGRTADRHAECRGSARARGGEAAAPHARRASERLVHRMRRPCAVDRAAAGSPRVQRVRDDGAPSPRHRLVRRDAVPDGRDLSRSEEHTSELQSLMRISYAVFCLKKKKNKTYKYI